VTTQRLYKSFPMPAVDVAFTSDSRKAILACGTYVTIIDLEKMEVLNSVYTDAGMFVDQVAVPPNSQTVLLAASANNNIYIYQLNIAAGSLTQLSDIQQKSYRANWDCMDFTADGKKLLVSTYEFGAVLFNVQPFSEIKRYEESLKIFGMAPDGSLMSLKEGYGESTSGGTYTFLDAMSLAPKDKFDVPTGDQWNISAAKRHKFIGTGRNVFVHDEGDVWYYDAVAKKLSTVFHNPSKYRDNFKKIAVAPDGKKLVVGKNSPIMFSFTNGVAKQTASFGSPMMWLWNLATSNATNDFVVCDISDFAKHVQLNSVGFGLKAYPAEMSGGPLAISHDGKSLFVGGNEPGVGWQYALGNSSGSPKQFFFSSEYTLMEDAAYSPDGKYLADNQVNVLTVMDARTGQKLYHTAKKGEFSLPIGKKSLAFSPDSKRIVFFQLAKDPAQPDSYQSEPHVICIDAASGTVIWDKVIAASGFHFTPNGSKIIAFDQTNVENRQNKVVEIDAQTGNITSEWNLRQPPVSEWVFAVSPDGKTVLNSNNEGGIDVFGVSSRSLVTSIKGHDLRVKNIKFLKNPRYVVSIGYDNTIRFYDLQTRKQLAQMVLFSNSNEWAVFTADGRFDASDRALKTMYYVRGKEFIPLESLYERYYTPKLLQTLLEGETFDPVPVDVEKLKSPPTVTIKYDKTKNRNLIVEDDVQTVEATTALITITIEAESKESAIAELRFYHNGKLVDAGTRNLIVEDDTPAPSGGDRQSKPFNITLLPGDNHFKAIAINAQRTESLPAELIVRYKDQPPTHKRRGQPCTCSSSASMPTRMPNTTSTTPRPTPLASRRPLERIVVKS
jgi:WD40 repeat protein